MFNEDGVKICSRYTVSYFGYLFYGDNEGWNFHDFDSWEDVNSLMVAYGDVDGFEVRDNEYSVTWKQGEWY